MNESEFHKRAGDVLSVMSDALESADAEGVLDVEHEGAVLTIGLPSGKQYLVSKHAPSRELWLSSPISGGLHFAYDAASSHWKLSDGRELYHTVENELETLAGVKVAF